MRRQLVVGAAAVTATVVIAFVVPLGMAVRVLAANRPLTVAEQTAQSVATVVALTDDPDVTTQVVTAARAQGNVPITVFMRDGSIIGAPAERTAGVDEAFRGAAFAADDRDGTLLFVPATRADGTIAVVQAAVPRALLRQGVVRSWLFLAGLALTLLLLAVGIADWLGRTVVTPVRQLSDTARRLADGDLAARAAPAGPPEVAEVGRSLNGLASRITALLAAEREMVAALSHRLRTPLTALRLDAEAVRDEQERDRLRADVDAVEATVTELIREARRPAREADGDTVDLVAVVRDRAAHWGALADDQDRAWSLEIEPVSLPVPLQRADAEALLDVLLDNVFTHTPEGTGYAVTLTPGFLAVQDAGPGLGNVDSPQRRRGAAGSTGLGLDIARQTARRLGATLHVTNAVPRGTKIELRLPGRRH